MKYTNTIRKITIKIRYNQMREYASGPANFDFFLCQQLKKNAACDLFLPTLHFYLQTT